MNEFLLFAYSYRSLFNHRGTVCMSITNNVINLSVNDNKDKEISQTIPELLNSTKRIARKCLSGLLDTMYNNVDDCLFEYADKADNNQQQMVYFL